MPDLKAVESYLAPRIDGFRGPVRAQKTATGQSNPTYILTTPAGKYVLRQKPPGTLLKSAHAVEREFRVMQALQGSDVPVPQTYFLCEDDSVLGAPFFVMSFVEGRNFVDPRLKGCSVGDRARVYDAMNAGLAALHSLDVDAAGLSDYGPSGNYFARQISRWTKQYRASETGTIPEMDALITWLEGHIPPDEGRVTLVHGDWRIDNLLFDDSGALVAVLDWELSTLGNPLADLGAQLMQWAMPVGAEGRGLDGVDRAALGIPSDREYVETYARRAGLADVPDMDFPLAFSFFRMGAILQGVKKRALDGNASNREQGLRLGSFVGLFAQKGLETVKAG